MQALGQKACVHGYRVLYRTSAELLSDLTASLADTAVAASEDVVVQEIVRSSGWFLPLIGWASIFA
jgi:hypothetical protein